jgi:hypothetical protein
VWLIVRGGDDGVVDFVYEFVGLIHEAVVFGGVGGDGGLDVEGGSLGKFGFGFGGGHRNYDFRFTIYEGWFFWQVCGMNVPDDVYRRMISRLDDLEKRIDDGLRLERELRTKDNDRWQDLINQLNQQVRYLYAVDAVSKLKVRRPKNPKRR